MAYTSARVSQSSSQASGVAVALGIAGVRSENGRRIRQILRILNICVFGRRRAEQASFNLQPQKHNTSEAELTLDSNNGGVVREEKSRPRERGPRDGQGCIDGLPSHSLGAGASPSVSVAKAGEEGEGRGVPLLSTLRRLGTV